MTDLFDCYGRDLLDGKFMDVNLMQGHIPKLIHFTAKNDTFRGFRLNCLQSVKKFALQDGFKMILWTDSDNDVLFQKRADAKQQKLYKEFALPVMKADFARLFFLYEFGGVYLDTDVKQYRSILENLPPKGDFYIALCPHYHSTATESSVMIARKKDDFVLFAIRYIQESFRRRFDADAPSYTRRFTEIFTNPLIGKLGWMATVIGYTGPLAVANAIHHYNGQNAFLEDEKKVKISKIIFLDENKFQNTPAVVEFNQAEPSEIVVVHDNENESTWSNDTAANAAPAIAVFVVVFVVLVAVACIITYYSSKHQRKIDKHRRNGEKYRGKN